MFQRTILNPPSRGTAQWTISGRQPPTMPWSYSFHSSMVAPSIDWPTDSLSFHHTTPLTLSSGRGRPCLKRSQCLVCALTDWATWRYRDQTYFRTISRGPVGSNLATPKPLFLLPILWASLNYIICPIFTNFRALLAFLQPFLWLALAFHVFSPFFTESFRAHASSILFFVADLVTHFLSFCNIFEPCL